MLEWLIFRVLWKGKGFLAKCCLLPTLSYFLGSLDQKYGNIRSTLRNSDRSFTRTMPATGVLRPFIEVWYRLRMLKALKRLWVLKKISLPPCSEQHSSQDHWITSGDLWPGNVFEIPYQFAINTEYMVDPVHLCAQDVIRTGKPFYTQLCSVQKFLSRSKKLFLIPPLGKKVRLVFSL